MSDNDFYQVENTSSRVELNDEVEGGEGYDMEVENSNSSLSLKAII